MSKIKKTSLTDVGRIHKRHNLSEDNLRFSFKYLSINSKFHIEDVSENYLSTLLNRLKDISSMSVAEFRTDKNEALRAHLHDWKKTTEKQGFTCLNKQLQQCEPWQFQLSVNQHGRVHGILLDEVFYLVWLDPEHKLYQ